MSEDAPNGSTRIYFTRKQLLTIGLTLVTMISGLATMIADSQENHRILLELIKGQSKQDDAIRTIGEKLIFLRDRQANNEGIIDFQGAALNETREKVGMPQLKIRSAQDGTK